MHSSARRFAENEILCREANAQMRWLDEKLRSFNGTRYDFLCECGNNVCNEQISLTLEEYERVHSDPRQFTIIPGHDEPSVEDIVERHKSYVVVRKHSGEPAELAIEHRPT